MAAWFKVSFNELLWHLYLSNTFYCILMQLDSPHGNVCPLPTPLPRLPRFRDCREERLDPAFRGCVCVSSLCSGDGEGAWGAGRAAAAEKAHRPPGAGTSRAGRSRHGTGGGPGLRPGAPGPGLPGVETPAPRAPLSTTCCSSAQLARVWVFLSGPLPAVTLIWALWRWGPWQISQQQRRWPVSGAGGGF